MVICPVCATAMSGRGCAQKGCEWLTSTRLSVARRAWPIMWVPWIVERAYSSSRWSIEPTSLMMLSRRPTLKHSTSPTLSTTSTIPCTSSTLSSTSCSEWPTMRDLTTLALRPTRRTTRPLSVRPSSPSIFTETSTWPRVSRTKNAAPVESGVCGESERSIFSAMRPIGA